MRTYTATIYCNLIKYWLIKIPIPIFGSVLGLLGLSLLAQLNPMLMVCPIISSLSLALGLFVFLLGLAIHAARFIYYKEAAYTDMRNLMVFPFLGQIGIALLLLAEILHTSFFGIAKILFELGLVNIFAINCWWLLRIVNNKLIWEVASPSWFAPPIGCLYIAILSRQFGLSEIGFYGLIAGLAGGFLALFMLSMRFYQGLKLPQTVTPALAIIVAIPALFLIWLSANNSESPIIFFLYWFNALIYCVTATLFFQFIRQPFAISWWAFGMPLTALSISLIDFGNTHNVKFALIISNTTAFCSTLITLILSIRGLVTIWQAYKKNT